jgi:hypothetical protein
MHAPHTHNCSITCIISGVVSSMGEHSAHGRFQSGEVDHHKQQATITFCHRVGKLVIHMLQMLFLLYGKQIRIWGFILHWLLHLPPSKYILHFSPIVNTNIKL